MSPEYEQVQKLAHQLPVEERMMLANDLMGVSGPDPFAGDDVEWDAEIARRIEEIKAGTAETCSLEDIEADWRSILGE